MESLLKFIKDIIPGLGKLFKPTPCPICATRFDFYKLSALVQKIAEDHKINDINKIRKMHTVAINTFTKTSLSFEKSDRFISGAVINFLNKEGYNVGRNR